MIHIAPCELHVRIRELEAELDSWRPTVDALKARAEKAENARDVLQADLHRLLQEWNSHDEALQKAEARVAELEKERHELRLAVFDTETLRVKEREAD